MAGRNPEEAIQEYARPIQAALSCITASRIKFSSYEDPYVLTFAHGQPVRLRRARYGQSLRSMYLDVTQWFRVIYNPDDERRGPYHVSTAGWNYILQTRHGADVIVFHWHPNQKSTSVLPHLHLGSILIHATTPEGADDARHAEERIQEPSFLKDFSRRHIPTGRISVEQVVRMCIAEFDVTPLCDDWSQVLDEGERIFEEFRSWSGRPPEV